MTRSQGQGTLSHLWGSSGCHCHSYVCFLFESSQTAEVGCGGGTGSKLRPPLCGAVYNSHMWDSQKETPNRTSCGCKIPRCQELKIAVPRPQPPRGDREGDCSLCREARGWPTACIQIPILWVPNSSLAADPRPPSKQANIPGCLSAS